MRGLIAADENEQELWEDESRSNLADDISEMVSVESDTDELQDVFSLLSDNAEAVNIVQWFANFMLGLQRNYSLPDAVLSLLLSFFSICLRPAER